MHKTVRHELGAAAACIGFIVLGIAAFSASSDYSTLGSVFPRTISALMVFLSVLYLVLSWLRPRAAPDRTTGSKGRQVAVVVIMVAWAFALQPIGFLTSSTIAFVLLLIIGHYGDWSPRLAVLYGGAAILVLGSLYVLFQVILQVPLPQGVFL